MGFAHVGQEKRLACALFGSKTPDLRVNKKESCDEDSQCSPLDSPLDALTANSENIAPPDHNMVEHALTPKGVPASEAGETRAGKEAVTEKGVTGGGYLHNGVEVAVVVAEALNEEVKAAVKPKRRKNAPPKVRLEWTPFCADLNALMSASAPTTRKHANYQYQELLTPCATISGYAVIHEEGPGKRKLVSVIGSSSRLKPGQTIFVQAGHEIPFGADAVVDFKFVMPDIASSLSPVPYVHVKDLAISGQNITIELRPYFVGGDAPDRHEKNPFKYITPDKRPGGYITAREYIQLRYSHLLGQYDEMFSRQFLPQDKKQVRDSRVQINADQMTINLKAIEASESPLLQALKATERRELSAQCQIEVFGMGAMLTKEGDCEEKLGLKARQMYLLVQGELLVNKFAAAVDVHAPETRATSAASAFSNDSEDTEDMSLQVTNEARRIEENDFGKRLGTVSKLGSLLGERQLLFGEPWPVTLRGRGGYKVLVIPLVAMSQVILQRTEMLEGLHWLADEQKLLTTLNHDELLLAISGPMHERVMVSHRASPTGFEKKEEISESVRQEKLRKEEAAKEKNAQRLVTLKRMLRLDPAIIDAEHKFSKEKAVDDELISIGALTDEQLQMVLSTHSKVRSEHELKWGKKQDKFGAHGDVLSTFLNQ